MLNFFLGSPQQAKAHVQKTRFGKWARQTYRDSWVSAAVDNGQPVNPEPRLQAKQGNSDFPHSFSWDKDKAPVAQHSRGKQSVQGHTGEPARDLGMHPSGPI